MKIAKITEKKLRYLKIRRILKLSKIIQTMTPV
jgi:hypothetical protein